MRRLEVLKFSKLEGLNKLWGLTKLWGLNKVGGWRTTIKMEKNFYEL